MPQVTFTPHDQATSPRRPRAAEAALAIEFAEGAEGQEALCELARALARRAARQMASRSLDRVVEDSKVQGG